MQGKIHPMPQVQNGTHIRHRKSNLEVLMLREEVGEMDGLVGPPLWHHHHTPNLLHLRVVWRTNSIQITCDLEEEEED